MGDKTQSYNRSFKNHDSIAVVTRYKLEPNLLFTKSLGFLWSFVFSGHFKLLIKVAPYCSLWLSKTT